MRCVVCGHKTNSKFKAFCMLHQDQHKPLPSLKDEQPIEDYWQRLGVVVGRIKDEVEDRMRDGDNDAADAAHRQLIEQEHKLRISK